MKHLLRFAIPVLLLSISCKSTDNKHLIVDKDYRKLVHEQYLDRRELAAGRDSVLFGVFGRELTGAEREGLEFLYAFMPLSDLSLNDGEYYLRQVQSALEARDCFSWGRSVPEAEFLHFVLPYRVNNEYTDTARQVFFAELKDRIKGLGMAEAALEVNHWCHEKVVYKSTDERTSGPLTTVRTAFGRCGEESTFAVAALRSVCIPARQVYTPRWAHTDDNHAWVEVWIDGKWHFMGACEPEPALDVAWFAEPVKRAMMTHTFVFGQYEGSEEVLEKTSLFTRLNLLSNYTKTKSLPVKVLGTDGKPVEKARVEFLLYNYAEFYPIATLYTGSQGTCSATTGYGDLLVRAVKNDRFGEVRAPGSSSDTLIVRLSELSYTLPDEQFTLTPPVKQAIAPTDQSLVDLNNLRLKQEDSIRGVYIASFIDSLAIADLEAEKGISAGSLWHYVSLSRGNWKEIVTFAKSLTSVEVAEGMNLLSLISEKDLHDIQAVTLSDHLESAVKSEPVENTQDQRFIGFVKSPRIGRELVSPWRSFIRQYFSAAEAEAFRSQPEEIRKWISKHIVLDTISNYYGVPLTPEGSLQLGIADRYSRDLLFVAIARSFGIPARLEPATRRPQYVKSGNWADVFFGNTTEKSVPRGEVKLLNASGDPEFIPRYYTHFTIGRFEKGKFVTLDYEFDESLREFPCVLSVDSGYYRLVTGNRQDNGSVLCTMTHFRVKAGEQSVVSVDLASAKQQSGILGKADLGAGYTVIPAKTSGKLSESMGPQGLIIALIDPAKEPTKHLMEDIKAVKAALDKWGGTVLFVVAQQKLGSGFDPSRYGSLPDRKIFGHDSAGEISEAVRTACSISGEPQWPLLVILNQMGEITWQSEGYNIGLGDQLVKQLQKRTEL